MSSLRVCCVCDGPIPAEGVSHCNLDLNEAWHGGCAEGYVALVAERGRCADCGLLYPRHADECAQAPKEGFELPAPGIGADQLSAREAGPSKPTRDRWKGRGVAMSCSTCMWFVVKAGLVGRCRRHAPTMSGYPVVFQGDWCGDHKLDEVRP